MTTDSATTLSLQDLLDERHALKHKTLRQPGASGRWVGSFRSRQRGQGSDFDDNRQYVIGDDVRSIDWKASARTNTLNTRLYREEREHRVTLLIDMRGCMFTGSRQLQVVRACRLGARLLWQATENGSRANVITIADDGVSVSEQASGHRAAIDGCALLGRRFQFIAERLGQRSHPSGSKSEQHDMRAAVQQPGDTSAASTRDLSTTPSSCTDDIIALGCLQAGQPGSVVTLDEVADWLSLQGRRHGVLIWLSGMDHCGAQFEASMEQLSLVTTQVAILIDDPMLRHGLPHGRYSYRVPDTGAVSAHVSLTHRDSRRLASDLKARRGQLIQRFDRLMIPLLSSEQNNDELISALRHYGYVP